MLVLNERSQTQKAACFMVPLTIHSGNVKTVKETNQWLPEVREGGRVEG